MESYRRLMITKASAPDNLEQGAPLTPGILGGPDFLNRLPRRVRNRFETTEPRFPLGSIVDCVATLCDLSVTEIFSCRRHHRLVLARALIAWYATEHNGTTLGETARFLRRAASTLSRTIDRHQRCHSNLFSLDAFSTLHVQTEAKPADLTHAFRNLARRPLKRSTSFDKGTAQHAATLRSRSTYLQGRASS